MLLKSTQTDKLKRARRHESDIANRLSSIFPNVNVQPGSGNVATSPNDVKAKNEFMVECKSTVSNTITMELNWLQRATMLASSFGLGAVVAIRFCSNVNSDYFVLPAQEYYDLLECREELKTVTKT